MPLIVLISTNAQIHQLNEREFSHGLEFSSANSAHYPHLTYHLAVYFTKYDRSNSCPLVLNKNSKNYGTNLRHQFIIFEFKTLVFQKKIPHTKV